MTLRPMTTKDWLRRARGIEARIRAKEAQRDRFRLLAMRAGVGSYEATRVSGTGGRSRVESGAIAAVDAEEDIRREIREMLKMRRDIAFVIAQIEDARLRDVLDMYYLTGWTWARIAEERRCDVRWVHVLHGKALAAARQVLKNNFAIVHCYSLSDVL